MIPCPPLWIMHRGTDFCTIKITYLFLVHRVLVVNDNQDVFKVEKKETALISRLTF